MLHPVTSDFVSMETDLCDIVVKCCCHGNTTMVAGYCLKGELWFPSKGASLKGKNLLPKGSKFLPCSESSNENGFQTYGKECHL